MQQESDGVVSAVQLSCRSACRNTSDSGVYAGSIHSGCTRAVTKRRSEASHRALERGFHHAILELVNMRLNAMQLCALLLLLFRFTGNDDFPAIAIAAEFLGEIR